MLAAAPLEGTACMHPNLFVLLLVLERHDACMHVLFKASLCNDIEVMYIEVEIFFVASRINETSKYCSHV